MNNDSAMELKRHESTVRLEWPDVAKGISILGVVLVHATQLVPGGDSTVFGIINQLLTPLRMPLFFLVSGYFSLKVLDMTFGELFTKRLWFFIVPYAVWSTVGLLVSHASKEGEAPPLAEYVPLNVLLGANGQWFLHALVLFNIVLWLTRRMPSWVVVLVAISPVLLISVFPDTEVVARAVMYLPVFLIGAYCRLLVTRFAEIATSFKMLTLAGILYIAGFGFVILRSLAAGEGNSDDIVDLLYSPLRGVAAILSIPAGIALSVLLVKIGFASKLLTFLGRHTLPVYLGHYFGLNAFGLLFTPEALVVNPDWAGFWILAAVLAGLAGGFVFHLISKIPVLGWTVTPPTIGRKSPPERVSVNR